MKKLLYLPAAIVLLLIAASCSTRTNTVKENPAKSPATTNEKELFAILKIKNTIKAGDSVLLNFTVYNHTGSVQKFLKWQTPFEPLMSKYLDIKNEKGEEVLYKGPMAKRMMPPPASAYISINPNDSLSVKVNVLQGYSLSRSGGYIIFYNGGDMSGLKVAHEAHFYYQ